MQKKILIIKPYGSSSNSFLKYLENEINIKLFCVEKLEEDFKGVIIFCKSKNELKKYQNKNNEYSLDFLLEDENCYLNLIKELKKITLNEKNILHAKFLLNKNMLTIKLSTKYNYKICHLVKIILNNFKQIQKLESAIRTKNCGIKLESCISLDDLWRFSKNVVILNDLKKNMKDIKNLAIGEFDLIHKGHEKILKDKNISILTFINNPNKKHSIFNDNYKINQIKKLRPEWIFIYDISNKNISAKKFIDIFLMKINPKKIIVGSDFKFGKNAKGNTNLLKKYFNLEIIERDKNYSTSKIKDLIIKNDFYSVNKKLYHDFLFEGLIVRGKQLGRKLGFPTANIIIKTEFPFTNGSYYSKVIINGEYFDGMTYITSNENIDILVETFIFDFNENIYGKKIEVIPLAFIRKTEKFNNMDLLINAIKKDESKARELKKIIKNKSIIL
ncbi:MAG: riboflavin kinase [Mycoplasmoidaceae bacterium]